MGLGKRAIVATLWASGGSYAGHVASFVVGVFIARVLDPVHFGQMALAMALVDFLFVVAAWSFPIAIIQSSEEREHLESTAFVLTIAVGVGVLGLVGLAALVLRRSYPPVVVEITVLLGLFQVLRLFGAFFSALLEKHLRYGWVSAVRFLSTLLPRLLALALALLGMGVWSLVAGSFLGAAISFGGMWLASGWRPSLKFSARTARWFFHFGKHLLLNRWLEVVAHQADRLVVGSMLGLTDLGFYNRSLNCSRLGPLLVGPVAVTTALPTYAKVQEDRQRFSLAFETVNYFLVRAVMVFVVIFAVAPEKFIVGLYGAKWAPAVPLLRLLSVVVFLVPLSENMKVAFYARGAPQVALRARVVQVLAFLPALYLLSRQYGIIGAAWAFVFSACVGWMFLFIPLRKVLDIRVRSIFLVPVAAGAAAAVVYVSLFRRLLPGNSFVEMLAAVVLLSVLYLVCLLAIDLRELRGKLSLLYRAVRA